MTTILFLCIGFCLDDQGKHWQAISLFATFIIGLFVYMAMVLWYDPVLWE